MTRSREHLLDPEIRAIVRKSFRARAVQDRRRDRENLLGDLRREQLRRRMHIIEQTAIFLLSAIAITIVNHMADPAWKFWGNVAGIASQPFWLLSTWRYRQWGMFVNAIFYTGMWSVGVVRFFPGVH